MGLEGPASGVTNLFGLGMIRGLKFDLDFVDGVSGDARIL